MIRKIKNGVSVAGLAPEMLIADAVVAGVYHELGARELVITSIRDGWHRRGSRHHIGLAVDYRRWSLQVETTDSDGAPHVIDHAPEAARRIAHRLRGEFDVVLEDNHLHVEFDPP